VKLKMENSINILESSFKSLGTEISLRVFVDPKNKSKLQKDSEDLKEFYSKKEKIFSRFNSESELYILNKNLGKFQKVSKDILKLSQDSLQFNKSTNGYFDPRIIKILENIGYKKDFKSSDFSKQGIKEEPEAYLGNLKKDLIVKKDEILLRKRIDFSGIAKGYITDQAGLFFEKKGWKDFLLDSGGDIFASGKWKISIEGIPEEKFSFEIQNEAVATSGITRRKWQIGSNKFHHLINPKNPNRFDFDLKSVTVIAKSAEEADVWAKVLFLMGKEKGLEFSKTNHLRSFFLDSRGNLWLAEKEDEKK
jgi:thiamine biosynthesis lipoprotein